MTGRKRGRGVQGSGMPDLELKETTRYIVLGLPFFSTEWEVLAMKLFGSEKEAKDFLEDGRSFLPWDAEFEDYEIKPLLFTEHV